MRYYIGYRTNGQPSVKVIEATDGTLEEIMAANNIPTNPAKNEGDGYVYINEHPIIDWAQEEWEKHNKTYYEKMAKKLVDNS